jgi:hypothetical protein
MRFIVAAFVPLLPAAAVRAEYLPVATRPKTR